MNGVHDMGGMIDFGPIIPERNEPVFHTEWERRVLGLIRNVIDPLYNWDEFRSAIERIDPVLYLSASYYERWLTALERYLTEKGVLTAAEFQATLGGWQPCAGTPIPAGAAADALEERREEQPVARFQVGDRVTARNLNPAGHTRLPRYVRGKPGTVLRALGTQIFPDTNALGLGEHPEPVYAVRFAARELWGEQASERDGVCVDLWESYLR